MKHTNTELTEIYTYHKGDSIHAEYFIAQYEKAFEDFNECQDWEDENESVKDHTLKFCLKYYLPVFLKYLKIGNSPIWANEIADSAEDESVAIVQTYQKLKKENPEEAKMDIEVYAKSLSNDELFLKYYLFLMEHDCVLDVEERAFNYVKIFKEQIVIGKSEIYSHEYADCRVSSEKYAAKYCECYAFAYEKALKEGKTEEYSRVFADRFGSFGCGNFYDFINSKDVFDLNLLERTLEEMKENNSNN